MKKLLCAWGLHSTKIRIESRLSGRCSCLWCGHETYPFGIDVAGVMMEEELKEYSLAPTKKAERSGWGGVSKSFKNWWANLR